MFKSLLPPASTRGLDDPIGPPWHLKVKNDPLPPSICASTRVYHIQCKVLVISPTPPINMKNWIILYKARDYLNAANWPNHYNLWSTNIKKSQVST